jgi:TonB family protein
MIQVLLLSAALAFAPQARPPKDVVIARLRVSEGVSQKNLIKRVDPVYPEQARKKHVTGEVLFEVTIDTEGNVTGAKLISGKSELVEAATVAVKEWKYKPIVFNGQPVAVANHFLNFTVALVSAGLRMVAVDPRTRFAQHTLRLTAKDGAPGSG